VVDKMRKNLLTCTRRMPHQLAETEEKKSKLSPLKDQRDEQACRLFHTILNTTNCIHNILPPQRDLQIDRLHHVPAYQFPFARTERYQRYPLHLSTH